MKATAKNTFFWILSVFFLLCALGFFPSIASILFVVVAIALAPIKKVQQFIDSCLSPKWLKTCCIIAFIIVAIIVSPTTEQENNTNPPVENSPTEDVLPGDQTPDPEPEPKPEPEPEPKPEPKPEPEPEPEPEPKPEPEPEPTPDPEPEPEPEKKIKLKSLTSPVEVNNQATITIEGKANTSYSIEVYYSSGASKAEGLVTKTSDENGIVSWSWKVGGQTKPGTYRIVIKGGGETFEVQFTVVK